MLVQVREDKATKCRMDACMGANRLVGSGNFKGEHPCCLANCALVQHCLGSAPLACKFLPAKRKKYLLACNAVLPGAACFELTLCRADTFATADSADYEPPHMFIISAHNRKAKQPWDQSSTQQRLC